MVGKTIKNAREGFGVSIRELARQAGVSAAQISRIEAGAVDQPSIDTLVGIARALDRNPKPLLIVSGTEDGDVPPGHAERLYEAAQQPKAHWILPGAAHGNYMAVAPAEYSARLVAFFTAALRAPQN